MPEDDGPDGARARMVREQLAGRGIRLPAVLQAMGRVPRERFVDAAMAAHAYDDAPLPIGAGQTISQPWVVARMLEAAAPAAGDTVLEVGAGSGYVAAVLACIARRVCALERQPLLAAAARERLRALGLVDVDLREGDGSLGWPEDVRFDAIVVSAGGPALPPALKAQLAPGGRLVMPVGDGALQRLVCFTRGRGAGAEADADGEGTLQTLGAVRFVPLVGAQGWPEAPADPAPRR